MEDFRETVRLRCTFCRSNEFALPQDDYSPPAGSFVVCANCGKENDITSLFVVAKANGFSIARDYAEQLADEMVRELKKTFKNNKFIEIK